MAKILVPVIGKLTNGSQSGRYYKVRQACVSLGHKAIVLELPVVSANIRRLDRVVRLGGGGRLPDRSIGILTMYSQLMQYAVQRYVPDLILSPTSLCVAFRAPAAQSIIWPDAPITGLLDRPEYPGFCGATQRARSRAVDMERAAFRNASKVALPSVWAAKEASRLGYKGSVIIAPFGPNMEEEEISEIRVRRNAGSVVNGRVLFVGADADRKGLGIAVDSIGLAREDTGIDFRLHALTRTRRPQPEYVLVRTPTGRDSRGRRTLIDEYSEASLFLLPTRAENFGAALAEAAACGVPVITSQTDGAWEAVSRASSGVVVPRGGAETVHLAEAIVSLAKDVGLRESYSQRGIHAHDTWLNYRHSVSEILRSANL